MAAGDAFTVKPYIAIPETPDYNNIISESESMKKEYLNLSATPVERWQLHFKALTSTEMNAILTHYKDQSGGYYAFSWQSVPTYINSGSNMTGHWVDKSWKVSQTSNKWSVQVSFEKSN